MISEHEKKQVSDIPISIADNKSRLDAYNNIESEITSNKWLSDKYTKILSDITDKYQSKFLEPASGAIHKMFRIYESGNVIAASLYDLVIKKLTILNQNILEAYSSGMKQTQIIARFITAPGSYILFYFLKRWHNRFRTPLLNEGVHLLVATMGGGKSSLMFDIIEELRRTTGYGSSVNTAIENTKFNALTNSYFRYHDHFDMWDKFGLQEEKNSHDEVRYTATLREQFDPNFLAALVFDEFISSLNRRNNKSTDYNKVFLAIFNLVLHKRHVSKEDLFSGIKRIYFLQQIDALDGLLDSSIDYKHQIEVDLDCTYVEWLVTGMLTRHILGWRVWSYKKNKVRNMKQKKDLWKLVKQYYRKKTFNDEDFESRNMGDFYNNLPKQNTKYNVKIEREGIRWT